MTSIESLDVQTLIFGMSFVVMFVFGIIWFHYQIIKLFFYAIKRVISHNFFKNNVIRNDSEVENNDKINMNKDVSKEQLEVFNVDSIESLKDYFYDIFLKFEIAYNNLDYNTMRMLSTWQMFENYYTGITLDLKAGQKKVINDIERKDMKVYDIDNTLDYQLVYTTIEISYITYTLNKDGYIISGNRAKKTTEKFEVVFRKTFEKEEITKCPNCGANIVGNKCDYCHSTIKNVEFKISSIKRIIN